MIKKHLICLIFACVWLFSYLALSVYIYGFPADDWTAVGKGSLFISSCLVFIVAFSATAQNTKD